MKIAEVKEEGVSEFTTKKNCDEKALRSEKIKKRCNKEHQWRRRLRTVCEGQLGGKEWRCRKYVGSRVKQSG